LHCAYGEKAALWHHCLCLFLSLTFVSFFVGLCLFYCWSLSVLLLSFRSEAKESAVVVVLAVAVAVLVVIPEGNLLLLICQAPNPPNSLRINNIRVAYQLSPIRYTDYSS
jgi:hypothetical protein